MLRGKSLSTWRKRKRRRGNRFRRGGKAKCCGGNRFRRGGKLKCCGEIAFAVEEKQNAAGEIASAVKEKQNAAGKSLFPWRNQAKSSREIAFPHWRNDSQAGILKHAPYLIGDPFPVTICPQPELRLMSIEKEILEIGEQVTEKEEQCFDIGNRGISKKRLHGKMVRYDTVPKHLVTDRRVQRLEFRRVWSECSL